MVRWKSKDLLFAAMLLWAGTVPGFTGSAPVKKDAASAPQAREDNRRFGTVFNNDINNLLYAVDSKLSAGEIIADYRRGLGEILAAKPGILAQNVGMPDPVIYRSKVATPWNKYVEGSQSEVVQKLLDTGTDPLTLTISECRKQGVRVVASYRMNAEDFENWRSSISGGQTGIWQFRGPTAWIPRIRRFTPITWLSSAKWRRSMTWTASNSTFAAGHGWSQTRWRTTPC